MKATIMNIFRNIVISIKRCGPRDKKRMALAFLGVFVLILIVVLIKTLSVPNGDTVESREKLLRGLGRGKGWQIATELTTDDYIVSGAYSENNRAGIAIFERNGENCKLKTHTFRDNDEIVISQVLIDNIWYDLIWYNGAETAYAEIVYTVDDEIIESLKVITGDMKIITNPAPAKSYELSVVYYDREGNSYS